MENKFDDSVLGRARVETTPELEAYYKELQKLGHNREALDLLFKMLQEEPADFAVSRKVQ